MSAADSPAPTSAAHGDPLARYVSEALQMLQAEEALLLLLRSRPDANMIHACRQHLQWVLEQDRHRHVVLMVAVSRQLSHALRSSGRQRE